MAPVAPAKNILMTPPNENARGRAVFQSLFGFTTSLRKMRQPWHEACHDVERWFDTTEFVLMWHQPARRVVEQLIDRHRSRDQVLLPAEIDDDFQNRAAGFDSETIGIERACIGQTRGALALLELPEDVTHHIRPRSR